MTQFRFGKRTTAFREKQHNREAVGQGFAAVGKARRGEVDDGDHFSFEARGSFAGAHQDGAGSAFPQ
jgi:hypothetical protein